MSKTRVGVLLGVVLVVGLIVGFGVAALVQPTEGTRIRNAKLRSATRLPTFD